jgi:hypothetical protein
MPKRTKAKPKRPDRYRELRAEWDRLHKALKRGGGAWTVDTVGPPPFLGGGGEWMVDKPELPVGPLPFLQTLRRLGSVMPDARELHDKLMQSDLIDRRTGEWSLFGTNAARVLPEAIEEAIAAGTSERAAIGEALVRFELFLDAQSFDAAAKRLQRLLQEWRKAVGQKRG